MTDMSFANRLKAACDGNSSIPIYGKGRQTWVKDQVGVSLEAVRKWFEGEARPRPAKLAKLAKALAVDESWLALGITPDLQPKGRVLHNARAAGAVNVFMGLVQLNGGSCAIPASSDPVSDYVSFYTIREGTQTSYHVVTANPIGDGKYRITLPNEYSRCAVIGAVHASPLHVEFFRMPHEMIERNAVAKGGYVTLELQREGSGFVSGEGDRWPALGKFD